MSYNKTKKKKKKFRKNSKYEIKLAQEDLDYLVEKTKFNAEEIVEWHSGFVEDNPGGTLNKIKMMDMYSSVLSIAKATMFVDQIFEKFDKDKDGTISFKVCQPVPRECDVTFILPGVHVGHQRVGVGGGGGGKTTLGFQTLRQR